MLTRDRIKPLLEAGLSVSAIARKVGVTPPTVCYHARVLDYHRNGRPEDNRLENLELLCPNCHSQTENFAGRNRTRSSRRVVPQVAQPPSL